MPLPVTEDTPPDMLAGAMDIKVLLPSGRTVSMSVERSTPMMDLLVQLTTTHKLSLAGHTTVALSDSGYPLHHLPSTPLGALDTRLIHVAQRTNTLKRAPLRPNNVQPFTTTFRLQVHLPRNQLFVTRVSPDTRLADILNLACSEKNLDPDKYELRHPANLCECLSLSHTLADYRLQEVTLVASRPPGAPLTPADIMSLQREEEKRRQQVKKTGGIYSIIFNKRSKGIPEGSGSVSSDSLNGRSISPTHSDESIGRSVSPPAPAPPTRPGRKRRPAPKPPVSAAIPVSVTHSQNNNRETGVDSSKEGSTTLSHSRTSSDSSGYHEASVLSESPDTRTNSSADTLPRRSKLPSTNHIVAKNKSTTLQHGTTNGNHNLSRSLSNLTAVGINAQNKHSVSTTSLASQGLTSRKKKAAPPPPIAPVKELEPPQKQENNTTNQTVSKPMEPVAAPPTEIKTIEEKPVVTSQSVSTVAKSAPPNSDKNIPKPAQIIPKLDDILAEEEIALDLTTAKRNSVPKIDSVKQTSTESELSVNEERTLDVVPSRVDIKATPVSSPDLVTSAIVHSPPPAVKDEEDVVEVEMPVGIPPSIEAVLRNNNLGGTSSPDLEEVSDWEYHLPAPPSAFRDLHSPTTTDFETVVLADANVFQEVAADKRPKEHRPKENGQPTSNRRREDSINVDSVSNESRDDSSLHNNHSSQSSQISLESHEDSKSIDDVVKKNVVISSEQDWEPQKIAIVDNTSKTKLKFNNGDLRLRQDGVTKEVYKVNPLFDGQHFDEDVVDKTRITPAKYQSEDNDINRSKNTINRSSSSDLQSSNQLKNFTISTYNKPKNMDSIFSEDVSDHSEEVFKKPFIPAKVLPVTRTNSYTNTDKDRPIPSVKRSTSYVSLARPYTKLSSFQSVNRTKSISNLVLEEDIGSSYLRKSTSEANLNQAEDVPLQSLQVLKSILPRLSQSQVLYESGGKSKLSYLETSPPQEVGRSPASERTTGQLQTNSQDTQLHQETESKTTQPAVATQQSPQETNAVEVPKTEPRPFVYRGPPAINFSTWQERPKIQVSLKSDQDYRMGKQLSSTNLNTSQVNVQQTSRETSRINVKNNDVDSSRDFRTVAAKVATQNKPSVTNFEERSTKIEPTPLTMRIISHTAPSNYRCYASPMEDIGQVSQPAKKELTSSITDLREERLPIVRAVELKKTVPESFVQLRNMSTTHLNGPSTNNVANVPVKYHQDTFYNRQSYVEPTVVKTVGPVSTSANSTLTKSVSTSQINYEAPDSRTNHVNNNSSGGKKYTSVVGINGSGFGTAKVIQHSSSVQNLQSSVQPSRLQNGRPNFSTVKVNGFGGPKPMPTVKGFRFAGTEAANYDRGTVKTGVEQEKHEIISNKNVSKSSTTNGIQYDSNPTKQPLKTLNGVDNSKSKSNTSQLTFGAKIQRNSSANQDRVDGRVENTIPEPPKPQKIVFKKPTQRPQVTRFTNPRDALMDAIKNFGGQDRLKPREEESNVILTK